MRTANYLSLALLLLVTTAQAASISRRTIRTRDGRAGETPRTGITVSAEVNSSPIRPYVVWWEGASTGWLGLWDHDPRLGGSGPITRIDVSEGSGWWDTGISAEDSYTGDPSYQATDLGRWTGLVPDTAGEDSTQAVGVSSMQTRPRWMEEQRSTLGRLQLPHIFLPGAHDCGAYKPYSSVQKRESIIDKYSVAQEESILWQLAFGIRYLDLRVAYYPNTDEIWWVNHGIVRFYPLSDILRQILSFISNTSEIVVLDFHEFPVGFSRKGRRLMSVHSDLATYLRSQLFAVAAPPSSGWTSTLENIWADGRRLVVSYNDKNIVANNTDFLWSAVSQKWGDVRTLDDLHNYLQTLYNSPPSGPWSAMAELTPTTLDVLLDRLGGLRRMADSVNRNVTAWYRGQWGQTVNAVAVDFFRGTSIIEAAIDWNLQRAADVKVAPQSRSRNH